MGKKEKSIIVRVPEETYRRFSAYVAWNGETMADIVRAAIDQYIAENEHLAKNFHKRGSDGE